MKCCHNILTYLREQQTNTHSITLNDLEILVSCHLANCHLAYCHGVIYTDIPFNDYLFDC
jgi:hypothetical protein